VTVRALLVLVGLLFLPAQSLAGGLFLGGHGVRPLGRGGAFTAGGDDPSGIWYNPATIAGTKGWDVLIDGSLVLLTLKYQRVDSGGNLDIYPEVENEAPFIPIPTLALAKDVIKDRLTVGFSISAPYSSLTNFPRPNYGPCENRDAPSNCIDTAATDAPQRYSLISLEGTLFLQLDLAIAWQIVDQVTLGVSIQNVFVNFVTLSSISSYNGFSSGPEDPEFDSLSQLTLTDMFNPSGKVGLVITPIPDVRIGVSYQLPVWIGGDARVDVQLPVSPLYSKSRVEGSLASLNLTLPMVLRVGAEVRLIPNLRLEVGFDWEQWSIFDALRVKPDGIYIYNIPGIDKYEIPDMVIPLNLKDTFAVRLGGEYFFQAIPLALRLGYVYESGAVEDKYASIMAWDSDKHMATLGISYTVSGFRLDLLYAHTFMPERTVDYRESEAMQVNPINPTGAVSVGGGRYRGFVDLVGIGLSKSF